MVGECLRKEQYEMPWLRRIFYRLGLLDDQDIADERNRSIDIYPVGGVLDPTTGLPLPASEEFVVVPRRENGK